MGKICLGFHVYLKQHGALGNGRVESMSIIIFLIFAIPYKLRAGNSIHYTSRNKSYIADGNVENVIKTN